MCELPFVIWDIAILVRADRMISMNFSATGAQAPLGAVDRAQVAIWMELE